MTLKNKATSIGLADFTSVPMRAFHMSWFAFFICFFGWFGLAPLMPVIRQEFHLTKAQIGNLTIASVAITVIVRALIGFVCDRIGPRRAYTWLLVLGSIPVMFVGLAHDYRTFLLFRLAIGAIGASFVITQYHTSVMFAPNVVGTANAASAGWGNLGGGVTQIVMPLLFAGFVSLGAGNWWGWRMAMFVPGVVMLATGIAYYYLTEDTADGDFRKLRAGGDLAGSSAGPAFAAACRDPRVWALFVIYAACFGMELTIDNIAALYFTDNFHLGLTAAGAVAASFGMMNIFARALGGIMSDRCHKTWGLRGRVILLGCTIFGEGLALMLFSQMRWLPLAVGTMMLTGLFIKTSNGATYAVVPFVNRRALGAVAGIVGAGGNVGSVMASFLFKGAMPWTKALFLLGAIVTVVSLFAITVRFSEAEEDSAERDLRAPYGQIRSRGSDRRLILNKIPIALTLLAAAGACAQDVPDPIKIGDVTFSATLRSRFYSWDWFQPVAPYEYKYNYSGNLLRLNFAEKIGHVDLDAELAVPFPINLPSNATAPAPQGALGLGSNYFTANTNHQFSTMIFPKQLYARYHFGDHETQTLQAGRVEFNDGTELTPKNATLAAIKRDHISARLIGTFAFADVGRSFDGVRYSWSEPTTDFTFLASTPTRGVFQTDGWGWNRVAFGYTAFTKDWGRGNHAADTRFFVIDYDDFRHILKTDNRAAAVRKGDTENIHIQTWGGHSAHVLTTNAGILDGLVWAVAQTGKWGTQTQRAYSFDLESGYQPGILPALKPWFRVGYTQGSGDSNAADSIHGTFFQILPTPRLFARTPFYNMMNTEDLFGNATLRPHKKVTVTSEFHALRLTNPDDFWYSGGGAFQPWTFGYNGRAVSGRRSLANLYDTQVEYRCNRHVTLTAYMGYAQGHSVMALLYPADRDMRFGYLEALFRM